MDNLNQFIGSFQVPELIILLGLGLALLLFGYRVKKIAFFIIWFLLGYNLIGLLMPTITQMMPEVMSSDLYQNLIPIAGGLLLALLGFSIEKLCVGGICFALVMVISARYFGTDIQTLAISAIVGIIAAGVGVTLMKPATILATAVAGAYALTLAILALFPEINQETSYWPMIIGMGILGAIFQFLTTKRLS